MLGRQPKLHGENVQQLVDSAYWTTTNRSIWTDTHMFVVKKAFDDYKDDPNFVDRLTNVISIYVLNQSMGYMKYLKSKSGVAMDD